MTKNEPSFQRSRARAACRLGWFCVPRSSSPVRARRANQAVAASLDLSPHKVGKWRNRFVAKRLGGLYDEVRSGRPRTVKDEAVATLISKTLTNKPAAATHWSVRSMAEETGLSKSTVHRLFQLFALQPHRTRSFKISSDPFFVEKLRDIVGLYLNPPDKALVLCVDEKSQVQALERTQPMGS